MVDRKCLWTVIFCTAEILGGCIAIILLPFNVLLALAVAVVISVCMIIFSLYMALGDNSKKDNRWKDW